MIQQHSRWVSCKCCNGIGSVITVSEEKFILIQKEAWSIFDAWSLERAGESRKHEITKRQKDRSYKGIFKRDHYAPKRSKRTIRYFEKVNRLMSLSIDPDCSEEILAEWENLFVSNVSRSEEKCGVHK